MTNEEKSSLINLLESYKPDGDYYDGDHNFDRQVDETVCNCLDNVIAEIKQMPTSNAWIKCSEQMPEADEIVFVYELDTDDPAAFNQLNVHLGMLDIRGDWYIDFVKW